jgi:hypothetical protein
MVLRPGLLHVMARWRQGECGTAKDGPDPHARTRVTGAGPHTRSRPRKRQGKQAALAHHINIDIPRTSFFGLKTTAALGVGSFFKISWKAHASPVFFVIATGFSRA